MTDRELLELIATQVGALTSQVGNITKQFNEFKTDTKEEFVKVNQSLARIEQDHGAKLNALFDGYKQNSDKLDRIEAEVGRHDKFILERIK